MKKYKKIRQAGALKRLEAQLLSGKKTARKETQNVLSRLTGYVEVDLTSKDIQRIEKEILTLKQAL